MVSFLISILTLFVLFAFCEFSALLCNSHFLHPQTQLAANKLITAMRFSYISMLLIVGRLPIGYSVPIPRDLVEVVITPKDVKEAGKYAMVKIPQIKENIKNNVKQKLLDRLMSKSVQAMVPQVDPATGEIVGFDVAPGSDPLQPVSQVAVKVPRKGMSTIVTNGIVKAESVDSGSDSDGLDDQDDDEDDDENGVFGYSESRRHGKGMNLPVVKY